MPFVAGPALEKIDAPDFDLEKTLNSGQVFHWTVHGPGFAGTIGEIPVYVEQRGAELWVTPGQGAQVRRHFALDHPMADIFASFPDDDVLRAAIDFSRGIRIIRQPAWECLATFLTSALKQVPHIRAVSLAIRHRYGRRLRLDDLELYAYPRPAVLAQASLDSLRACKLGFRAKNLLAAARMVAHGELDLDAIRDLPLEEARTRLGRVPGVGPKIANCVLLFAYERLDVVPVDVWIHRAVSQTYLTDRKQPTRELTVQTFSERFFGPYAGYAQQFLFHHWRMTYRRGGR
jgi:N-glycosylase/DNA lyase